MPIYEYRCQECGEKFEKLVRSFSSVPDAKCPKCGGRRVEKALSLFGTKSSGSTPSAAACGPVG
jgi:putative FmdB family regulatory protein